MRQRSFQTGQEVGRIHAFFPILQQLSNRWVATRPWEGHTIGLNLHLTPISAALAGELALGGGTWIFSAANPRTTHLGVVELLRSQGIEVYTGGDLEDRHRQVLSHKPDLLVDVGFELIATALSRPRVSSVKAAIELSRTGITRLRAASRPPFPVVNIHDGRLKHAVENRNGVGEAVWHAVVRLTGMHLAGRRAAVLGYGPVGRGLAANARSAGMNVEVVEQDPVRRLFAHYDGFPTPSFHDALARAGLIVTATGQSGVVDLDAIRNTRDGVVLLNAGHGGDEISVSAVEDAALQKDHVADQVVVYHLDVGHRVTVLGGGHPLNIVLNSGSPEPVMLHFALLALTLEWLSSGVDLPGGEIPVERELEEKAAKLALAALNS